MNEVNEVKQLPDKNGRHVLKIYDTECEFDVMPEEQIKSFVEYARRDGGLLSALWAESAAHQVYPDEYRRYDEARNCIVKALLMLEADVK